MLNGGAGPTQISHADAATAQPGTDAAPDCTRQRAQVGKAIATFACVVLAVVIGTFTRSGAAFIGNVRPVASAVTWGHAAGSPSLT